MDIEGVKKDINKSNVKKYIEEYNQLDFVDNIDNRAILSAFVVGSIMDGIMNYRFLTEPQKAMARVNKFVNACSKADGKALLESEEQANAKREKAKKEEEIMKTLGIIQENDPATFEALLNGDKESIEDIRNYIDNLESLDPEIYTRMTEAKENEDWDTYEQMFVKALNDAKVGESLNRLSNINPELYKDMIYVGEEIENNGITDQAQIPENSDLESRIERLENTFYQYMEMQQGINPQTQVRAGEEKEDKSRAVYEKDGISIEVAEGLQPEQEQELQHGQEFAQAEQEVTDEELEQAEKEVQERDIMTEDGTVSIILGNSKKITIQVEPYIAGDKETQMAQEANEQEQIASREESTEMIDDTTRE